MNAVIILQTVSRKNVIPSGKLNGEMLLETKNVYLVNISGDCPCTRGTMRVALSIPREGKGTKLTCIRTSTT